MPAFFVKYSYMAMSIGLMAIFVVLYLFSSRSQRKPILISALLSTPFGFASVIFVPEYWNPVRVAEFGAGPEDLIFSFANGGTIWILTSFLIRRSLNFNLHLPKVLLRYAFFCAFGIGLTAIHMALGLKPMTSVLLTIAIVGLLITILRRDLSRVVLPGMLSFLILYTGVLWISLHLFPDLIHQWSIVNLSGVKFFGVPLEETVWAAGFGAVWPLFMAYVFDAKAVPDSVLDESTEIERISPVRQVVD